MKKFLFFLFMLLIPYCPVLAVQDYYEFSEPNQKLRFDSLTTELRCLVCQNQNLAESNSGLAADLREQVYQHIQKGESDKEIVNYLVARYGNFILYRPPLNILTVGLWFGPFSVLIIGLCYLIYYIRRKQRE